MDHRTWALLAGAVLCASASLELSQVIFALVGALAYALVQAQQLTLPLGGRGPRPTSAKGCGSSVSSTSPGLRRAGTEAGAKAGQKAVALGRPCSRAAAAGPVSLAGCCRQPSACPVAAPEFTSSGFEEAVTELLGQISTTPECDSVVQQLAETVKIILARSVPEVEVVGLASGRLVRGRAFGVAVPEVDVVVHVSPDVLAQRIHGRLPPAPGRNASGASSAAPLSTGAASTGAAAAAATLDARKLQKSAVRIFTDRLVSSGSFKFRRSAFRGQEPKVTLLATLSPGLSIPVDFSVNSWTPLCNAALLTECGQIEPRAKELATLVKRWAKDRGVCHAAKGHLSPHAWTLLAIYYLQVGLEQGGLLPPLKGFRLSSSLAGLGAADGLGGPPPPEAQEPGPARHSQSQGGGAAAVPSVAQLFRGFLLFYADFDWQKEAVSVRLGQRAPAQPALPLRILLGEDGKAEAGPAIESPFEPGQNVAESTTAASLGRLREELLRAKLLCQEGLSLAELLEPWAPPEAAPASASAP